MKFSFRNRPLTQGALLCFVTACAALAAQPATLVLVAGKPSHGPGEHEHNAGVLLLEKLLRQNAGVKVVVARDGWPEDEAVFQGARAVVFFCDGGRAHPFGAGDRLARMGQLMRERAGLVLLHYAVQVPNQEAAPLFLDWMGGYYEAGYSRNPVTDAHLTQASPRHPISRGWADFDLRDEWYYHLRFRPEDKRVTPILTMMAGSPAERETVAWATQREDGGRSFGFTGGHFHANWGVPEFRRVVVNGILWAARLDIPAAGAKCDLRREELSLNLDAKPPRKK